MTTRPTAWIRLGLRGAAIAIAAALGLGTVPALAADIGQLGCPMERLTEPQRTVFVQGVRERAPLTDPRLDHFRRALDDCARNFGWSSVLSELARLYNLGATGQAEARRDLAEVGIDVAPIERALLADTELVSAVHGSQYPEQQMNAFIGRLSPSVDELVSQQPPGSQASENLGMFIMYRAIMESARIRFGQS